MKILLVHNAYGKFSGEEAVVRDTRTVLLENGHEVIGFERSSAEIPNMRFGPINSFFSGIYNPRSRQQFRLQLRSERPDLIHIHNLYPLISPSILPEAKAAGISVVMTVHNYRLVCPNGLHYVDGNICERCVGGREYWCVLKNCETNIGKSLGYAMRSWWARVKRYYLDNVSIFACLTQFQRDRLLQIGIPADRLVIIPNMARIPDKAALTSNSKYVGFCGRLSPEKGISVLMEAARLCPDIPFVAAGRYEKTSGLTANVPDNFKLLGHCDSESLASFYSQARFIALPSVCFEGFPTVLVDTMFTGKPVVCSNIGGLPEIVDDGFTGLLVQPGNAEDLAKKIRYLWEQPALCKKMGNAGRQKAVREYSQEKYYERLMGVYQKALTSCCD